MAKKLNKVLGVDFGSQFIKIAEISQQGGRPAVTALGIAQTPEGAVDHMGISDDAGAALSSVLKQLAASSGSGSPDVVASIAGTGSVLVRTLEVPAMSKDELKKHMDWEITRNVPFAEPDPVSAYEVYESEAGAQNVDVVMAIAPPSKVSNLSQLVKKSGKKAAAFDVEPLALARLLATSGRADLAGKTVCVVEIGHKTTAINMYEDGQLLMPRQVPIGGELFTRAISEGLNVSMEEAEDIKINKAKIIDAAASAPVAGGGDFAPYNPFADAGAEGEAPAPAEEAPADVPEPAAAADVDEETMKIYNAIASVLDEFVAEIRRSVDYFRSKGGNVDNVFLCGGGSRMNGLVDYVNSSVGITTELLDPFAGLEISAKKADPTLLEESKQDFAVAVGNGLQILF